VINTGALITYLENGHLGGACLDVYEKEKGLFFYDHRNTVLQDDIYARLCSFKNVLLTGHQASLTNEALQGIAAVTIANLDAWAKRETSENEVT
jgi:D-lactate dehydrogenase